MLSANIRRASDNVAFDGDGDGIAGGNFILGDDEEENFFALFGDTDGDRLVGVTEFGQFRSSFGKASGDPAYNGLFEFDGDNAVGIADFGQFRSRFGQPKMILFKDTPSKLDYSRDSFSQSMGQSSSPWARVTYDTDATRLTVSVNANVPDNGISQQHWCIHQRRVLEDSQHGVHAGDARYSNHRSARRI